VCLSCCCLAAAAAAAASFLLLNRSPSAMASQIEQIGRAFIQHYYTVFDADRSKLEPLYVR
jgi:hypothetical protein